MTVKEILDLKGKKVICISEEASVMDAVSELVNNKIGLLIVKKHKWRDSWSCI